MIIKSTTRTSFLANNHLKLDNSSSMHQQSISFECDQWPLLYSNDAYPMSSASTTTLTRNMAHNSLYSDWVQLTIHDPYMHVNAVYCVTRISAINCKRIARLTNIFIFLWLRWHSTTIELKAKHNQTKARSLATASEILCWVRSVFGDQIAWIVNAGG